MVDSAVLSRPVAARPDLKVIAEGPTPAPRPSIGAGMSTARLASIACDAVTDAFDVDRVFMRGRRRGARKLAAARQYAMALVHLVAGRSQEDVARCFTRNRTTASHHMEMIEFLNDAHEHDVFWNLISRRFELMVELRSMPSARRTWLDALRGIDRALDDGVLEGDGVRHAMYIRSVFWEERCAQVA